MFSSTFQFSAPGMRSPIIFSIQDKVTLLRFSQKLTCFYSGKIMFLKICWRSVISRSKANFIGRFNFRISGITGYTVSRRRGRFVCFCHNRFIQGACDSLFRCLIWFPTQWKQFNQSISWLTPPSFLKSKDRKSLELKIKFIVNRFSADSFQPRSKLEISDVHFQGHFVADNLLRISDRINRSLLLA